MTKEEAIYQLMGLMPSKEKIVSSWTKEHLEALSMAIRALENNSWHKVADGDLPEDGQHILYVKKMLDSFFYETIYYPEPPITDGIDYWMEIPEIPKED